MDNGGYEPRRRVGNLKQATTAHKIWVIDRTAMMPGQPLPVPGSSDRFTSFKQEHSQSKLFAPYPNMTLVGYRRCDRGASADCATIKNAPSEGTGQGDTEQMKEWRSRIKEINVRVLLLS